MIGPDGHLHRCGATENSVKGLGKSTTLPIAQSSDLLTSNFMPCHCLGTLGPYPHPMKQLKENPTRCNLLLLAPTDFLRAGSVCGLGSDICGIHIISLAARPRTAATSGTLVNGLAKIRAARECDGASNCAHTSGWEERFLKTSMAFSIMEACEYVRQMDRTGRIADSPRNTMQQKAATTLLSDTIQERDFALPIAKRASNILGPTSGHHVAQIPPMIRSAASASCPG